MHKRPQPVRLWYWGPFFRHEAPQAGRFRQFTQIGAEVLGSDDPAVDAEVIALLADILEEAGARELRLRLSSLGTAETRSAYAEELQGVPARARRRARTRRAGAHRRATRCALRLDRTRARRR